MNWTDIIEILKIAGSGFLVIDAVCFMYIWFWKELHYSFHIMLFYIPGTGVLSILSDFKETFREMDSHRGGLL